MAAPLLQLQILPPCSLTQHKSSFNIHSGAYPCFPFIIENQVWYNALQAVLKSQGRKQREEKAHTGPAKLCKTDLNIRSLNEASCGQIHRAIPECGSFLMLEFQVRNECEWMFILFF